MTEATRTGDRCRSGNAIIGIGTDIVACQRIVKMLDKHDSAFLERVFTSVERAYCCQHKHAHEHLAGRWAAKEAVLKALGTGWAHGIQWSDVEIENQPGGKPLVRLHGKAQEIARQMRIGEILISISHCREYAVAFATALGEQDA
ncbi:MAG: holo-[acyl-carrier-protein] synthase [Planctomycetota bacterium]|nr:MAG: holo-[acyl-carrier-protein] synthase [Planctomycetota bacterium]